MQSDDDLLDNNEGAPFIGYEPNTLRNSRHTGKLAGVTAPAYIKMGRVIRYRRGVLRKWKEQFPERTCTRDHLEAANDD